MAKTRRAQARDRPAHPRDRLRRARPRPRGADLRRAHLHADHRRRGVAARRRSRRSRASAAIKAELPGVKTSLGVSNVSLRRLAAARARCSTRSSCTTASRPGSTWRWSTRTTSRPTPRSPTSERELADDLVFNRREDALERFIAHFESQGRGGRGGGRRPDRGHGARGGAALAHPAPQEGRRRGLDRPLGREDRRRPDAQRGAAAGDEGGRRQVRRRRADPALRAAVRRGDEARRRAARELPRADRGPHQGQGRARDRVRRRPRHRQVAGQHDPHQQRLHGRSTSASRSRSTRSSTPRSRTRPTRSASRRCSSRPPSRCRSASRSCTSAGSSSRC